jgi:hypothetical protein
MFYTFSFAFIPQEVCCVIWLRVILCEEIDLPTFLPKYLLSMFMDDKDVFLPPLDLCQLL